MRRVGRIFRAERTGPVRVIVDLPENLFRDTRHPEGSEITFSVGIIAFREVIETRHFGPDADLGFRGQGGDSARADDAAGNRARPEM